MRVPQLEYTRPEELDGEYVRPAGSNLITRWDAAYEHFVTTYATDPPHIGHHTEASVRMFIRYGIWERRYHPALVVSEGL